MTDTTADPHPSDAYLSQLEKLVTMATPGPWVMRATDDDGAPAPRIVAADTGEPILEPMLPNDDPERVRDIGYDAALAVVAVVALPHLTQAVRRLKADLAEAVGSLQRLLATAGAMDERLARLDPEYARTRRGDTASA